MALRSDLAANTGLARLSVTAIRVRELAHRLGPFGRVLLAPLVSAAWWWLTVAVGAEIPPTVHPGGGFRLPHAARGVIIHPAARIGADVTLYHRVTLGVRGTRDGAPRLGDGVYVGCGATILGDLDIADGARVGAGAVCIANVAAGQTYTGMPSRH